MPGSITHMLALAVQTEGLRTGYDQAQRTDEEGDHHADL